LQKPFYSAQIASFINNIDIEGPSGMERGRMVCPGLSVLVVDDEPMNLLVARGIFETYEMKVDTVPGGWEAIEACENKDYDVIFMDHMMPQMDGVETMKHLRMNAGRHGKKLCIVALTANAISSAREMFLSEGFDGFIPKPIVTTELERVLKHILPASAISYRAVGEEAEIPTKATGTDSANAASEAAVTPEKGTSFETAGKAPSKEDILEGAGIYMGAGLVYCSGDKEFYFSIIEEYGRDGARKTEDIERYYTRKDWKNYEILVHSLKSTSRTIGAEGLSELAAELEKAAKNEDEDLITSLHPKTMSLYKTVYEAALRAADPSGGEGDEGLVLEFLPEGNKR
ncbi:MAG: response regulator, partial [Lachnospiraceae bacterium]|nr:response regulator [Lachnospiraceae bacterium]